MSLTGSFFLKRCLLYRVVFVSVIDGLVVKIELPSMVYYVIIIYVFVMPLISLTSVLELYCDTSDDAIRILGVMNGYI